jgi:hypothetical protein
MVREFMQGRHAVSTFNQIDHQFQLLQNDPHIPRDIQEVGQSSKSKPVAVRSLGKWANLWSTNLGRVRLQYEVFSI